MFDAAGCCIRAGIYLSTWYSFANPKAVLSQMYCICLGIYFACSGIGYVLALGLGPDSAQLAAAVVTLVSTLMARKSAASGGLFLAQQLSFARWALEGFVIAESNREVGVWLLARCADLMALGYDVRRFSVCLIALGAIGVCTRGIALGMLLVYKT